MDELYGFHITATDNYYSMPLPENMVTATAAPVNYGFPSPGISFPVLGSEQLIFSCSTVSDSASASASVVADQMPRGGGGGGGGSEEEVSSAIRAKIASHPLYPKLLQAYIDCQKVGAPPEIAYMLDQLRRENDFSNRSTGVLDADPELDEFVESYCEILMKYKSDLSRSFNEATTFLNDVEAQLNTLCNTSSRIQVSDEGGGGSSSDEDVSGGGEGGEVVEVEMQDRELKDKLLRKYSGYISSLKHEFSKKKKKGKLPKDARQILLNWWNVHYRWPYPTEADKVSLADATGLDQKQINNWFINQRKRHWKPSENMQFGVVESLYGACFVNE